MIHAGEPSNLVCDLTNVEFENGSQFRVPSISCCDRYGLQATIDSSLSATPIEQTQRKKIKKPAQPDFLRFTVREVDEHGVLTPHISKLIKPFVVKYSFGQGKTINDPPVIHVPGLSAPLKLICEVHHLHGSDITKVNHSV